MIRHAFVLALPLLLTACVLGQVGAIMHPTVSGDLGVRATDGSETRWTPDRCISGDLNYFLGFDFASSHDANVLRIVRQPTAGAVIRWESNGAAQLVNSSDCAKFELSIAPTGWRVNEVREFAGYVDLQCRLGDGTSLAGRISVDHCH